MIMSVSVTPGGEYCLEAFLDKHKITAYVTPDGKTACLKVPAVGEIEETGNLFSALKWLHESDDKTGAKQ